MTQRVGQQLSRASHVIVDLGEVTVLDPRSLAAVLVTLHQKATAGETEIHLAGAAHDAVHRALHLTGFRPAPTLALTADAVIAALIRPRISSPGGEVDARGRGRDRVAAADLLVTGPIETARGVNAAVILQ